MNTVLKTLLPHSILDEHVPTIWQRTTLDHGDEMTAVSVPHLKRRGDRVPLLEQPVLPEQHAQQAPEAPHRTPLPRFWAPPVYLAL